MSEVKVTWHGDDVRKRIESHLFGRLVICSEILVAAIQRSISQPYPPASDPYQPPHLRKGNLYRGIHSFVTPDLKLVVVSSEPYSSFLEKGTAKMKPRPFAKRTLHKMSPTLKRIIER